MTPQNVQEPTPRDSLHEHLLNGEPDPIVEALFDTHILPSPLFEVEDVETILEYADTLKAKQPEVKIDIEWEGRVLIHH
jgi:hypothetical protein